MSKWIVTFLLLLELAIFSLVFTANSINYFNLPETILVVSGCCLIGGIGATTYCLRGVYLNTCVYKRWDTSWLIWYAIRPIIGIVIGGVSYLFIKSGLLLLGATQTDENGLLGLWAFAFLGGLNVDNFIAKFEEIGKIAWGVEPSRSTKEKTTKLQGDEDE